MCIAKLERVIYIILKKKLCLLFDLLTSEAQKQRPKPTNEIVLIRDFLFFSSIVKIFVIQG